MTGPSQDVIDSTLPPCWAACSSLLDWVVIFTIKLTIFFRTIVWNRDGKFSHCIFVVVVILMVWLFLLLHDYNFYDDRERYLSSCFVARRNKASNYCTVRVMLLLTETSCWTDYCFNDMPHMTDMKYGIFFRMLQLNIKKSFFLNLLYSWFIIHHYEGSVNIAWYFDFLLWNSVSFINQLCTI